MQRRLVVSLILIAILLAGGIGSMHVLFLTRPKPPAREADLHPLLVQAVRLEPRSVTERIVGYGTARADRYAWLSARVAGEVVELAEQLRVGARVSAGQILLRIDDREYREQLKRAESMLAADEARLAALDVEQQNLSHLIEIATNELDIARREYDRVRDLLEHDAAGRRELDLARAAYEAARRTLQAQLNANALLPQRRAEQQATCKLREADVALARLNVERCAIAAPFDGRIEALQVELGEQAAPGNRLLAVLDPSLIEVPIELPVSVRERVRVGAACTLAVDSSRDFAWTGRVNRIAPMASEATRTFELFVEVNNAEQNHRLVPGVFVRAVVDGTTLENVLVIPRGVIRHNRVYVYRDGKAYPHDVRVQRHLLDQSIVAGLAPGDMVITSNLDALQEGTLVRIEAAAAARASGESSSDQK